MSLQSLGGARPPADHHADRNGVPAGKQAMTLHLETAHPSSDDAVPIIDLADSHLPQNRAEVAASVAEALDRVGAFYAVGTLITPAMTAAAADAFRPFFETWTEDERSRYAARPDDDGARGYVARFAAGDDPSGPDRLRSFVWHPYDPTLGLVDLLNLSYNTANGLSERQRWQHTNQVPADLPGARDALRVLAALFDAVRGEIFALLEEGLGWHPGRFADWLAGGSSTVVVNHYEPVSDADSRATCLDRHTDLGGLTVNALDGRSGIDGVQYRGPDSGQWYAMPEPPPGAVPIFAGRLLGAMKAARPFEHRVVCTREDGQPNRMSVVGFGQPAVTKFVTTDGYRRDKAELFGDYYAAQIGRARMLEEPGPHHAQ